MYCFKDVDPMMGPYAYVEVTREQFETFKNLVNNEFYFDDKELKDFDSVDEDNVNICYTDGMCLYIYREGDKVVVNIYASHFKDGRNDSGDDTDLRDDKHVDKVVRDFNKKFASVK